MPVWPRKRKKLARRKRRRKRRRFSRNLVFHDFAGRYWECSCEEKLTMFKSQGLKLGLGDAKSKCDKRKDACGRWKPRATFRRWWKFWDRYLNLCRDDCWEWDAMSKILGRAFRSGFVMWLVGVVVVKLDCLPSDLLGQRDPSVPQHHHTMKPPA